ncbi:hypothetical protein PF334_004187 [Salmonella enterica]|nr:hypothetical protein [Salmonella enterica]EKD9219921.1 hypothetical protein [Salmonella enterica]EKI6027126.1 hypothetical protein [Salmonella enterica]ELS1739743.1 hypothetical protein [Salmonella enterica]ELZ3691581.1 hypothetical protein [Salmonella enterica]
MQTWLDLPPEAKRSAGGWRKWAQAQGVTLGSASLCLTNTGLTPYGRERLHPLKERGMPISVNQIQAWRALSAEARNATGGWVAWAQSQGIAITSARKHLTNTGLTLYGMERLQHPEEKGSAITKAQLLTWLNMSPEEHSKAGGWITWAQAQGIATNNARIYLSNTGLTARGMERIQRPEERGFPITDRQMQTWRDLPQATKREAGGWAKWVQARGISIASAKKYLTNTGLTPHGMELLRSPEDKGAPISDSQLLTWLNMSPEEHSEAGGWKVWVQSQGIPAITPVVWSLTLSVMAFSLKYSATAFSNSSGLRLPMNEVDICSLIPSCCPPWLSCCCCPPVLTGPYTVIQPPRQSAAVVANIRRIVITDNKALYNRRGTHIPEPERIILPSLIFLVIRFHFCPVTLFQVLSHLRVLL